MLLVCILLLLFTFLLTSMLSTSDGAGSRPVYRWAAIAVLAQASLFFGFTLVRPADPIDAWGFQDFYGALCALVVVAATIFIQKDYRVPDAGDDSNRTVEPPRSLAAPSDPPAADRDRKTSAPADAAPRTPADDHPPTTPERSEAEAEENSTFDRTSPKPSASIPRKPRESQPASEPVGGRVDGRS